VAKYPALPLWTDAYLADTRHLAGPAEHGAYLLLLMEAWRRPRCALPDNDSTLARLACCTPDQWADLKPVIMAFWEHDSRRKEWTQKRLLHEHKFLTVKRDQQRHRAKARWDKNKTGCENDAALHASGICRSDAGSGNALSTPTPFKKETPKPLKGVGDSLTQNEQKEPPARPRDGDGSAAVKRRPPPPTAPPDEPDDIPFEKAST
jgi:uncharacterized protein YdaU (DUF1376 family)